MKRAPGILLVLLLAAPLPAEICVRASGEPSVLAPGGRIWTPVRTVDDADSCLNPLGDLRGDLSPVIVASPASGAMEVAWPVQRDGEFDLWFAWWSESAGWSSGAVSELEGNDLAPRLAHDAWGNRYLAWRRPEGLALSASRPGDAQFSPTRILESYETQIATHAVAAAEDGSIRVAWIEVGDDSAELHSALLWPERDLRGILLGGDDEPLPIPIFEFALDVSGTPVLAEPSARSARSPHGNGQGRPGAGGIGPEAPPLDLQIHEEDGTVWIDWIEGFQLRFVVHEGPYTEQVRAVPLRNATARAVLAARARVRSLVLDAR